MFHHANSIERFVKELKEANENIKLVLEKISVKPNGKKRLFGVAFPLSF